MAQSFTIIAACSSGITDFSQS